MSAYVSSRSLTDWLAWLERQNPDRIELGLKRVRRAWRQLGRGIESTVITVGGTNGKGSVVAMLEQALLANDRRVIAYTSPHLLRFNERIRIQGADVDDVTLVQAFEVVAQAMANAAVELTYFEFTTLAALWLIAEQQPDVALLEVGLGGRLDAVNIIAADAAVITSIGLDHQHWLGTNRASIATEKVAIARPGRLLICAEPDPPLEIRQHADKVQAKLMQIGEDFTVAAMDAEPESWSGWSFAADWLPQPLLLPPLSLSGQQQYNNAAAVLALLTCTDSPLPALDMRRVIAALSATRVPGRQQRLCARPELIIDVAHNEQAVAMLVDSLLGAACRGRTWIVLAMLADKDVAAVVERLSVLADHWLLPQLHSQRALPPQALQQLLLQRGVAAADIGCHATVTAALEHAMQRARADDRIVVLGSFVTVAALMADWPADH